MQMSRGVYLNHCELDVMFSIFILCFVQVRWKTIQHFNRRAEGTYYPFSRVLKTNQTSKCLALVQLFSLIASVSAGLISELTINIHFLTYLGAYLCTHFIQNYYNVGLKKWRLLRYDSYLLREHYKCMLTRHTKTELSGETQTDFVESFIIFFISQGAQQFKS